MYETATGSEASWMALVPSFRVLGFRGQGSGFKAEGVGFRVEGLGFRVQG